MIKSKVKLTTTVLTDLIATAETETEGSLEVAIKVNDLQGIVTKVDICKNTETDQLYFVLETDVGKLLT